MAKDHRRGRKTIKTAKKSMNAVSEKREMLPANDLIGRKLREYYDEVAREPVPDRFTALLDALASKSAVKKPS